MKPLDYVLIVAIAATIIAAIYFTVKNARKGRGCCGRCSHCNACKDACDKKKKK